MPDEKPATVTTTKPKTLQYTAINLRGPEGARLEVFVKRSPTGAQVGVDHSVLNGDGKTRTHSRGASSAHTSWKDGLKQQQKLVEQAIRAGWVRPVGVLRGPRPDAFDAAHIPAPAAPKPEAKAAGKK
jgi:hypothetical protein